MISVLIIISLTGSTYSSNTWTQNSSQLALNLTGFANISSCWLRMHVPASAHEGTPIYAIPLTVNKTDVWQLANSSNASISPPLQSPSIPVYPIERENLSCVYSINRSKENVAQGSYVRSWNLIGQRKTMIVVETTNYTVIKNYGSRSGPIGLHWWISPGGVYWLCGP